jgi:hypothetical protein
VASFTGSYTVPVNSGCSITSTLSASGNGFCTGRFDTVEAFYCRECGASTRPPRHSSGRQALWHRRRSEGFDSGAIAVD